jgi:thioredoxin 1
MSCEIKTLEEYEKLTKTNKFLIIHFWAIWNNHDITAKNILGELEMEFAGDVKFCSLDIDQEIFWELIKNVGAYNFPAFAYFKDGDKVGIEIGLRPKKDFRERLNHYFFS